MDERPILDWEIQTVESSNVHLNFDCDVFRIPVKVGEINSRLVHLQLILRVEVNRKFLAHNVAGVVENDAGLLGNKLADIVDFDLEKGLVNIPFGSEIQIRGVARTFKVSLAKGIAALEEKKVF